MNVLIPIAGNDLIDEKTQYLKTLYEIEKKVVIQHIVDKLKIIPDSKFIFVIKNSDIQKYHIDDTLRLLIPSAEIVISPEGTQGSACSCLLAIEHIDNEQELLISGSDQIITKNWKDLINDFRNKKYEAGVVTFDSIHPKWSFVKINNEGFVVEASEKKPISRHATTGQYYFKHGSDFVEAAKKMIFKKASVNDQYYVSPTFNEMILQQKKIGYIEISNKEYFSLKEQRGMDQYENYLKGKNV